MFRIRRSLPIVSLAISLAGSGCADGRGPVLELRSPGPVSSLSASRVTHASIDEAAVAALAAAQASRSPRDRSLLRLGTVRRTEDGYVFTPPRRSETDVFANRAPTIRFSLTPDDVATYVVHPPSGDRRLDRLNAGLNESERRMLEELDTRHRPIYLLTPELEVLRFEHEGEGLFVSDLGRAARDDSERTAAREER